MALEDAARELTYAGRARDGRPRPVAHAHRLVGCSREMQVLNFYSTIFGDQLKRGRKTATIRLGDKSHKYRKNQAVMVTIGYQHSPREKIFDAVIDQVEVKRVKDLTPRDIEHDNPEFRRHDEMIHFLEQIYGRPVSMDDTVTVVRFSQIVERPPHVTDARAGHRRRPELSGHPARRAPQPADARAGCSTRGINQPVDGATNGVCTRCDPPRRARRPVAAAARASTLPRLAAAATQARRHAPAAAKVTITTATLDRQGEPPRRRRRPTSSSTGRRAAYGSRTPDAGAGAGTRGGRRPRADRRPGAEHEVPLPPRRPQHRRHHERAATARSRTPKQPLGLALAATPNPVAFGAPSTLAGTLSGTGNAGRPIQLQQKPFPFTAGVRQRRQPPAHERPGRLRVRRCCRCR